MQLFVHAVSSTSIVVVLIISSGILSGFILLREEHSCFETRRSDYVRPDDDTPPTCSRKEKMQDVGCWKKCLWQRKLKDGDEATGQSGM